MRGRAGVPRDRKTQRRPRFQPRRATEPLRRTLNGSRLTAHGSYIRNPNEKRTFDLKGGDVYGGIHEAITRSPNLHFHVQLGHTNRILRYTTARGNAAEPRQFRHYANIRRKRSSSCSFFSFFRECNSLKCVYR